MKKDRTIKEEAKDWKQGKSKRYTITEIGTASSINNSLFDMIRLISKILDEAKKPEMQALFKRTRELRIQKTTTAIEKFFFERHKEGLDPFKEIEAMEIQIPRLSKT